ncbi:hypothetical protein [Pseudoduganella violaceinigra]|uniref:hypothetical protein n=1 Tax=Pseudoduganella violaceinigra TaxID=246602 RepID=UPI0012B5F6B5|nr:hypothetical protein [Pseudoduganella violaceinigra]
MNSFASLSRIDDCSVAMDGGSLGIALSDETGTISHFMLNRSLAAVGGPTFNQVSDADGPLNEVAQVSLLAALTIILARTDPSSPCFDLLNEFAGNLGGPSNA